MSIRRIFLNLFFLIAVGLLGAQPAYADSGDQLFGTLLGASMGGLIGSSFGHGDGRAAATGAGIAVGGFIGHEMTRPSYGYSYGRPSYYVYDYAPVPTYYAPYQPNYVAPPTPPPQAVTYIDTRSGGYCREYSQQIRIGNQVQESYGTACLQADGSWHIVK